MQRAVTKEWLHACVWSLSALLSVLSASCSFNGELSGQPQVNRLNMSHLLQMLAFGLDEG